MGAHSPEQRLISAVLRTGDLRPALHRGVSHEVFLDYTEEWKWITERYKVNKRVPSKPDFKAQFPGFPVIATDDVDLHSRAVVDNAARAHFFSGMSGLIEAYDAGKPLDVLLDQMRGTARTVASTVGSAGMTAGRLTDFQAFFKEAKRRHAITQANGSMGIPYGFQTLDEDTGGMAPGQLIIAAARPSVGKSWMLNRWAEEAVMAGKVALFASLEMNHFAVTTRMVSLLSSRDSKTAAFDPSAMRQGRLGRSGVIDLGRFLKRLKVPGELHIMDSSRGPITPYTLEAACETLQPDVVLLDYLQLFARQNSGSGSDLRLEVARHSSTFKQLAETRGIPFVTASQLNRSGDSKVIPPGLSTLSESDSPAQDADVVITMVAPSNQTLRCCIAKNREGPDGRNFWIKKLPGEGIIEECTREEADELAADEVMR